MDPPAFIPARESRTGEEAGFCVIKESTLEAVLERPVHDESGSVPEFDEEEYARQMGSACLPEAKKEETTSLSDILALPQPIDLWPGAVYIPPRISRLEEMIQAANQAETKWESGEILEAAHDAAAMIQPIVRKVDGQTLTDLTVQEIKDEFDVLELIQICHFILRDQGLAVEGVSGNAPSGRLIGVKNFHSSAATTEPMTSPNAESSPSSNLEL